MVRNSRGFEQRSSYNRVGVRVRTRVGHRVEATLWQVDGALGAREAEMYVLC